MPSRYYHNKITGQTSWSKPGSVGDPNAPDEWEEIKDDATGKVYYFNAHSGQCVTHFFSLFVWLC